MHTEDAPLLCNECNESLSVKEVVSIEKVATLKCSNGHEMEGVIIRCSCGTYWFQQGESYGALDVNCYICPKCKGKSQIEKLTRLPRFSGSHGRSWQLSVFSPY